MWTCWTFCFSTKVIIRGIYRFCTEKYWSVIFDKDLFFTKNHVFHLKKWNLPGAPTKVGFTVFFLNFAHVLYVTFPKNLCVNIFCFVFLRSTDPKKNTIFLTLFCRHCQREHTGKIPEINNKVCWVGTLRNFHLFRQKIFFLVKNKYCSKINI